MASCPRAGTNYLYALLSAADDAARRDGPPQYEYFQQKYSDRGRWSFQYENRIPNNLLHLEQRLIDGEFDCLSERYFVLSHYPAVRSDSLFSPSWTRPVVVVRHPLRAARSLFDFYYDENDEASHRAFLNEEVQQIVRFLNYWGPHVQRRAGKDLHLVRYEALRDEPVQSLSSISDFWEFDYSKSVLEVAAEACKREKMIRKIPNQRREENKRVSVNRSGIPSAISKLYRQMMEENLKYDFGYDLR